MLSQCACLVFSYKYNFLQTLLAFQIMPKYSTRVKGLCSATWDHPWQIRWLFDFVKLGGDPAKIQCLDKMDVEALGNKDQIRISKGTVIIHMGENYDGVHVDVKLPPGVKKLAVHQYGIQDPICIAEDYVK